MQLQGIEKIRQARARLFISQPFFGSASLGLTLREDNNCPTAYTDGRVMGYNVNYVNNLSLPELESLICHETLHCVLHHPIRMKDRDRETANTAMDYVVNGIIKKGGGSINANWLWHEKYSSGSMSWEAVYAEIFQQQQQQQPGQGGGKGQSDNGQGQQQGAAGQENAENSQKGPSKTENGSSGSPTSDDQGQGKGETRAENEYEPWQAGEVRPATTPEGDQMSPAEEASLENDWKVTANRALQYARAAGKVPSGMERIIEEITVKKRDLEEVLRDFVSRVFQGDFSYRRPNKRYLIHDLYVPSVYSEKLPEVAMILDTSGSIASKELSYFKAKLEVVLSEYQATVHIIYCDTRAHYGGEFGPDDLPLTLKPKGGGGTDFKPPFKYMEEHDIDPALAIYFTDLCCYSYPQKPDFPVLWAVYGSAKSDATPWGEVVNITPE